MPGLRELQQRFATTVFEEDAGRFADLVRDGRFPGDRLLQVYRHNSFASLTVALEDVYPVVARLVGEGFFHYAADAYIRQHPSTSGDLHDFGDSLASFLADFPPAATLPYLPDVARLEWAYHRVFHAAEHDPLSLADLAAVPAEQHAALHFSLHPATWLLESTYPVLRIWQANQPEADAPPVSLAEGGDRLLVLRNGLEIEFKRLGAGEYRLLHAFAAGRSLLAASDEAVAAEAGLDLAAILTQHVQLGTLAAFRLHPITNEKRTTP